MESQLEGQFDTQQRLREMLQRSMLLIFAMIVALAITLILSFNLVQGPQVSVELNQPAPQDVVAPQSKTYISNVLTEQRKEQAAAAVPDQYTSVDINIGREQINFAQSIFSFVDVVRADPLAEIEVKARYIQAITDLNVESQISQDLLLLNATEYAAVRADILRIIEDTMRAGVVTEQLSESRRRAALGASFNLTPAQERVVVSLAPQFVVPNIFFDEAATEMLKAEAASKVDPVSQIVTKDERIIRVGDVIDEADIEMLGELGLLEQEMDWRRLLSIFLAAVLSTSIVTIYWNQYLTYYSGRYLAVLGVLFLLFVLGAKLMAPGRTTYGYLYPAAALSMLVAVIFNVRLALLVTFVLSSLVGYIAQNSLEMAAYSAAGGVVAVMTLRDTQRINALFRAGLVVAVCNSAVVLVFRLPQNVDLSEIATLLLFGILNGPIISSSLSLAGIFVIGTSFGITTPLQLQELSRLDHPLLQDLLRRAPGTYHHSIWVANLAEQAAEKIKANSTLVRVGAFYHDVGKMNRPPFFSENQNGGNPHDSLDPYSSARIIMSHVTDGLELAKRYRLPHRIRDFIAEHHGDRVLKVFYNKAQEMAAEGSEVDVARFQYGGPRPRSRETGIVQLADSIEATSSALRPNTEEAIEKLVNNIVDDHIKEGQLDDSGLTMGDIKLVRESFSKTLKGRFHTRVKYPGNEDLLTEEDRLALAEVEARRQAQEETKVMPPLSLPVPGSSQRERMAQIDERS